MKFSHSSSGVGGNKAILSLATNSQPSFYLQADSGGDDVDPVEFLSSSSSTVLGKMFAVPNNEWFFVSMTLDCTHDAATGYCGVGSILKVNLHIQGVSITFASGGRFDYTHIVIGGRFVSDTLYGAKANIDDLRIYSRVLTQPEIALLAGQSSPTTEISPCTCGGPGGETNYVGTGNCLTTCPQVTQAYSQYKLVATSGTVNLASLSFQGTSASALQTQYSIEALTGMSGWTKIKHKPQGDSAFTGNTFQGATISGIVTTGNSADDSAEWAITFNPADVRFYCFHSKDSLTNSEFVDRWVVMEKSEMAKASDYVGEKSDISCKYNWCSSYLYHYKSTHYPNGFTAKTRDYYTFWDQIMYNRAGTAFDPQVHLDMLKTDGTRVVGTDISTEFGLGGSHFLFKEDDAAIGSTEGAVYIKTTPDT